MNVGSVTEEDVYIALVVVPIIVTVYCPLLLQTPNRILKVCTVSGTFQKKFFLKNLSTIFFHGDEILMATGSSIFVTTYCVLFSLEGVQAYVFLTTRHYEYFYLLIFYLLANLIVARVYGVGICLFLQTSFGRDAGDVSERVGDANHTSSS